MPAHVTTVPSLNLERSDPLVPPAIFSRLREEEGVSKVVMPNGVEAWLITRHDLVRSVLAHESMSSSFFHLALLSKGADVSETVPGMFNRMDAPDHTLYRKALQKAFTAPSIAKLQPAIERLATQALEECESLGPQVDFVETFALPIPSLVICELLGVPYDDRERFHRWSRDVLDITAAAEAQAEAKSMMPAYISELAAQYRVTPGDGLISELANEYADEFTNEELGGLGFELLLAGHETTANMMSLSALVAMTNPAAREVFVNDATDEQLDLATRELLRYLSITHMSPLRRTKSTIEVGGITIQEGEYVCCHVPAANRDPRVWEDPDALKLDRPAAPHLAFGFGAHICLGQALARLELKIALPMFFKRFPGAQLDTEFDKLRFRQDMFVYGMHSLPTRLW